MIESRSRGSLLGMLALVGGLCALALTRFNPTGISTVTIGWMTMRLSTAVAAAAMAVGLIGLLLAASSPRTRTGIPVVSLVVCGAVLLPAWKPDLMPHSLRSFAPSPATQPVSKSSVLAGATANGKIPAHAVKQNVSGSSTLNVPLVPSNSKMAAPAPATPPAHIDSGAAIEAAHAKLEAARENVIRSLENSAAYRDAKAEADAADAGLKELRKSLAPGSPDLVAASQAALEAYGKVQKLIASAAEKDAVYRQAEARWAAARSAR